MEDVNISKYRASVVREGSKPASPGFVVSEGQSPTDPAGSGQNHLPVTITPEATGLSITENQVLGGAGTVSQYIRGDGSLADFPESSGGGSSVSYYLNGSVNQGTIGGVAYKELNKVPILGAGTDFTINANGYIASFLTDAGDPNLLEIPGGNWNFETYFSANNGGGSPTFYVELYKYNGTTFTLIASNSAIPELIAFGTNITAYFTTLAVPTTTLALTDRLAVRYYVTHSGRTITMHTEGPHLCQIITTFTTGLTALNGLTAQVQNFAVGTSGTDFAIASATATHTFNLPTASATNRGALSSSDWSTFNGKQNALTLTTTGSSGAATLVGSTLNIPIYSPDLSGYVPTSRTITINGTTQDLSANRTFNVGTVTSVGLSSATSGVTIGSTPVTTSGTITLAIATASGSQNGLLSSTDWTTFNSKQNALTNPVTGTGTTNYLAKFTGSTTVGNTQIYDAGGFIGINTASAPTGLTGSTLTIRASNSNVGQSAIAIQGYDNTTRWVINGQTGADLYNFVLFSSTTGTGYDPRFIFTPDGNFGINNQSPFSPLSFENTTGNKIDFFNNGTARYTAQINNSELRIYTSLSADIISLYAGNVVGLINVNGKILIGTTSDNGARLQVSGTSTFSNIITANSDIHQVSTGGLYWGAASTYLIGVTGNTANGNLSFITGSTVKTTITSSGNVGINTNTPTGLWSGDNRNLNILSPANFSSELVLSRTAGSVGAASISNFLSGTNADFGIYTAAALNYVIYTNNVQRLTISSSGNVGIGTTSPDSQLTLNGSSNSRLNMRAADTRYGTLYADNGVFAVASITAIPLVLGTNDVEAMRITSGRNVLIGTTTDNGARLQVNGLVNSRGATTNAGLASNSFIGAGEFMSTGSSGGYFWENRSGGVTSNSNWYGWYTTGGVINLYNGSTNLIEVNGTTGATFFKNNVVSQFDGGNGSAGTGVYNLVATTTSTNSVVQATIGAVHLSDGYANLNLGSTIGGSNIFWHISKRLAADSHQLEYYYYNGSGFTSRFIFSTSGVFTATNSILVGTNTSTGDTGRINGNTFTNTIMTWNPENDNRSGIAWRLGGVSIASITPNRRLRVNVGGVEYYIGAVEV